VVRRGEDRIVAHCFKWWEQKEAQSTSVSKEIVVRRTAWTVGEDTPCGGDGKWMGSVTTIGAAPIFRLADAGGGGPGEGQRRWRLIQRPVGN